MGSRFSSQCPSQPASDAKEIECCTKMLEDLQIRCMISANMFYEQSKSYDKKYSYGTILASVPTGVAAAHLSSYIPLGTGRFTAAAKTIIGFIMATLSTYKLGGTYILDEWNEKRKVANEAGAAWQSLELEIRLFLCSMQKEATLDDYKKFTYTCIEKRKDICLVAIPDASIYQKYHKIPNPTLEWYKTKSDVLESIKSEMEKEKQEKQQEDSATKLN